MAAKKPKKDTAALAADEGVAVPRIGLGEVGFGALKVANGRIYEEANRAFRPEHFFRTIDEMRKTAIIASALNAYRTLMCRVPWSVEPPIGASEQDKQRAKAIDSMRDDMEISWGQFIADVSEFIVYGHGVQEKVYRRRLAKNGSKFSDGLVGIRKLTPRPQETLQKWEFSEDGRELVAVCQSIANLEHGYLYQNLTDDEGLIRIPREKFLLFTADATRGNPLGHSILKGVYLSHKQLTLLKEKELLSIAKESAGLPLIRIPAKFMAADASDEEKAVYETCKQILTNLANGTSEGIVFPTFIDPESKKDMFDVEFMKGSGGSSIANVDQAARRYQDEILSTLGVDILKTGSHEGSFSLADSDTNVLALAVGHRLNEIADVLNHDLVPQLYRLNGWGLENLPKFVPGDITSMSADELGKLFQRTASVGVVVKDIPTVNRVRKSMGVTQLPDDTNIADLEFTMESSNAGEGMKTPFDGTAKKPTGKDSSTQNSENAA
jgi:hypothetical protein